MSHNDVRGYAAPGFEKVAEVFAASAEAAGEEGVGIVATLEGETVLDLSWGESEGKPWTSDTLVCVYSCTKGMTALVAQILADVQQRGDAAVLEYSNRYDDLDAQSIESLELTQAELKSAYEGLPAAQREALQAAARRVRSYHGAQHTATARSWSHTARPGPGRGAEESSGCGGGPRASRTPHRRGCAAQHVAGRA